MSTVREALEAAMAGGSEPEPIAAIEPAVEVKGLEPEPEPKEPSKAEADPNTDPAKPETGARERDETGKFAKKGEPGQDAPIAAEKSAEPEPQTEAIRPPPSLPAAVKAKFGNLDKDVQEAFVKIEKTVHDSKAEWGPKGERLNRWDEILAPRREKFQLAGIDEFTAVQTLFAAQDLLDRSPLEGLQYLARSYGVDLRQLAPQTSQGQPQYPGQPGQQPQQPDLNALLSPHLQPVLEQVRTLQQKLDEQAQASQTAQTEAFKSEVAKFAEQPEHLYFDNVKEQMIGILKAGQADSLEAAYEMAIWASPEIRPLLLQAQTDDARKKAAEEEQRRKSAQAKAAAGSVTGAPGTAVTPPRPGSMGSIRADLQAAMGEHAAGV